MSDLELIYKSIFLLHNIIILCGVFIMCQIFYFVDTIKLGMQIKNEN